MILSEIKQLKTITATNYQTIHVKCDICEKEWNSCFINQQIGIKKYGKDLCRGCKQHEQIILGIRRKQYINAGKTAKRLQTGKTIEERLGLEKANIAKSKMSITRSGRGNNNFGGIWRGINPAIINKGKSLEEVYGEEKAKIIKQKISLATSGENNPMYGKPSPKGSGNGWSGWYKGWFFRSLKELSYMIYVIERFNLKWESGEKSILKIKYLDYNNNERTYHADFLINNKFLVEIKPKHLWNSYIVKRKKEFAENWCKENGLKYKLTECPNQISFETIKQLIEENKLLFTERYQKKWIKMES